MTTDIRTLTLLRNDCTFPHPHIYIGKVATDRNQNFDATFMANAKSTPACRLLSNTKAVT